MAIVKNSNNSVRWNGKSQKPMHDGTMGPTHSPKANMGEQTVKGGAKKPAFNNSAKAGSSRGGGC